MDRIVDGVGTMLLVVGTAVGTVAGIAVFLRLVLQEWLEDESE